MKKLECRGFSRFTVGSIAVGMLVCGCDGNSTFFGNVNSVPGSTASQAAITTVPSPSRSVAPSPSSSPAATANVSSIVQASSNLCVADPGYSTSEGAQYVGWACDNGSEDQYAFSINSDGSYTIQNQASSQCLVDLGWATALMSSIGQYGCDGSVADHWFLQPVGSQYTVKSAYSGLCLALNGNTNGATLVQVACDIAPGYNISLQGQSPPTPSGPTIPANAIAVQNIQQLFNWIMNYDPGTTGSASGTSSLVSSPAISGTGSSRQFNMSYTNGGGEIYYISFGQDSAATNFVYDTYVYITNPATVANLEMDMNQVMSNGQTVIYGFQCDGYAHTWDFTENSGTPTNYTDKWINSNAYCDPKTWSANTWHHVQIQYSRDSNGVVTYQEVWLDGVGQPLVNATVPSAFALGWSPTLLTNFQIDGLGASGSNLIYATDMTVSFS